MAIKEIVQNGDPLLRQKATPIAPNEFGSAELTTLIADMRDSLAACDDGVGLAAPQIGISKRIFIVSHKVFITQDNQENNTIAPALVFINPTIEKLSKTSSILEEGCLSVRGIFGHVVRADKTRIRALDEYCKPFTYNASGLLAEIFQHEVNHLDGILYIDHAHDTYTISHEEEHETDN